MKRAYGATEYRQQRAERLVYSEREFRTALGDALRGEVSAIRLGGDVIVTGSLDVGGTYNVVIDGGGKYSLIATDDRLFNVVADLTGMTLRSMRIQVDGITATSYVFSVATGKTITNISVDDASTTGVRRILNGTSCVASYCTFSDLRIEGSDAISLALADGFAFDRCTFIGCTKGGSSPLPLGSNNTLGVGNVVLGLDTDVGQGPRVSSDGIELGSAGGSVVGGAVTTTNATTTTLLAIPYVTNKSCTVDAIIIGRRTNGTGQSTSYKRAALLTDVGGVLTVTAIAGASWAGNDIHGWLCAFDANGNLTVTGAIGETIEWKAQVRFISN